MTSVAGSYVTFSLHLFSTVVIIKEKVYKNVFRADCVRIKFLDDKNVDLSSL